jgi:hypothetical protein
MPSCSQLTRKSIVASASSQIVIMTAFLSSRRARRAERCSLHKFCGLE